MAEETGAILIWFGLSTTSNPYCSRYWGNSGWPCYGPSTHHCPHQQDLTNFFKTSTGQHLDELTDLNALDHLVVVDSVPELDEAVDVSPPAVGAEEELEDSVPELSGDFEDIG